MSSNGTRENISLFEFAIIGHHITLVEWTLDMDGTRSIYVD